MIVGPNRFREDRTLRVARYLGLQLVIDF